MPKIDWVEAEEDFKSFFKGKDHYVFQFHDTRAAMGASGSKKVFTTSHPSDFIVTSLGLTFFAEVKDSANEPSFPFGNVKPSQWAASIQTTAAGGLYFFFIRRNTTGLWYKVPASVLIEIRKSKQSVRWLDLSPFRWNKNVKL